jgi:hypothetical protein
MSAGKTSKTLPFLSEKESVIFTTQTGIAMPFGATFVLTTVHWYVENDTLFRAVRYSSAGKGRGTTAPAGSRLHFSATMTPADEKSVSTTATITLERDGKAEITRRVVLPGWFPEKSRQPTCRSDAMNAQKGSALLIVLMILALMAALAAEMTISFQVQLQRTRRINDSLQGKYALLYAEAQSWRVFRRSLETYSPTRRVLATTPTSAGR